MKITINNEEVLCNKDFTINEEMLNTSSVILNNVYPKTWEEDKNYVSRFYYPKDYSKCKIFNEIEHPTTKETAEGTSFSITADLTKQYQVQTLKGQTTQSGTPTPTSPQKINITTGEQVVRVCGKNLLDESTLRQGSFSSLTSTDRLYFNSNYYLEAGTYTLLTDFDTSNYYFALNVATNPFPTNSINIYNPGWNNVYHSTFTISQSGYFGLGIRNRAGTSIVPSDIANYHFMLYKGNYDSSITYEEYKGNDYEINLGKNLCDYQALNLVTNGNGTTSIVNNYYDVIIDTLGVSSLYVSGDFTLLNSNTLRVGGYSVYPSTSATGTRYNITSNSAFNTNNHRYIMFCFLAKDGHTIDEIKNSFQIEKGNQFTGYSAYKTPIYLGKIGTYQDYIFRNTTENPLYDSNLEEGQWYIHKEIGKYTITGNENWTLTTNASYNYNLFSLSSMITYFSNYKRINGNTTISNNFKGGNNATGSATVLSQGNNICCFRYNAGDSQNAFYITNNSADVSTFKNIVKGTEVYYVLNTPTNTLIEDEELINQLNSIELLEGLNNVSITSPYLPFIMSLMYNYQEGYTEEELYFCGIVKNTGEISLNPRHPHYCNIQVLDFKDFLSQGETLDFVITEKTIGEAIEQVIGTIAPYGFVKGIILLDDIDELMGTYSTKDKTAYDVFNYIADITQSRWTTRMVDENTIAIDFFDPNKLPLGEQIEYNQTWFRNHKIDDLSYSYSSNDYRNKQVMLSGEVYSNIETTEILVADGYQTQFNTIDKIGKVSSLLLNGTPVSIITKEEYDLGYDADFYYQPGNKYFESVNLVSTGAILTIVYYAIIEGREVILNQEEINLIEQRTGRKGIVARYENRNDATTTGELQAIGQSYLEYKGIPEIKLNVSSRENTWNIGDRVYFNAPLDELKQTYMVKAKKIQRITTIDELFYQYELTSSFNMEQDINYFDNQRYKSKGNIGEGEFISRNIDIENTANVIFYDLEVEEVEVEGNSTLQSELQSVLGGVE